MTIDGGTEIFLRGKHFTRTKQVMFDKTPATEFEVISDKQLRVVSPPHAEGLFRIWVTTKQGRAKPGAFDGFRYVDNTVPPPPPPLGPTVTGLSPKQGTIFGGTTVTITGTNFTACHEVMFGTSTATNGHGQLADVDHRQDAGPRPRRRRRLRHDADRDLAEHRGRQLHLHPVG